MPGINRKYEIANINSEIVDVSIELTKKPSDIELLLYRSALYLSIEKFEDALDDLDHVLHIAPSNVDAMYLRANLELNYGYHSTHKSIIYKIIELENIEIETINESLAQFYMLLLNRRALNIVRKIKASARLLSLQEYYQFSDRSYWN